MAIATYLLYVIIVVTSALIYFIKKRLSYWKEQGIPHNEPSWMMGNFEGIMKTRSIGEIYQQTYDKFKGTGPFCGFYFQQKPIVVALDIEFIKNVLIRDFNKFTDRGLYHNEEDDPLTGNLFMLDGQKWRSLRHKLSPTFSSGKMKFMYPSIIKVADEFVKVFTHTIESTGNQIEIKDLLARFTTDVIGQCAFGIECNSLKNPETEFRVIGRSCLNEHRHGKFLQVFIHTFPTLARRLHMRLNTDKAHNFFMRLVRETVDYRTKNNIKRNDFLNILLELNKSEQLASEMGDAKSLTLEEMAAQMFVFFLGGFETSSSTMGFVLYELAHHQKAQDRLRQEVLEVYQKEGEFSYESIKNMQYMDMVISETLRKYPIVPHLNRQALVDYEVADHPKYVIKKGMNVIVSVLGIHHDPQFYAKPEEWDPERFSSEKVKERDSVEFLAFGDGPRNCIGMRFGEMQTRVGLTYLLKNFKFSVCSKTEQPLVINKASILLSTLNGIYLHVEKL